MKIGSALFHTIFRFRTLGKLANWYFCSLLLFAIMNIEHFLKTDKKLPVSLKSAINIMVLGGRFRREINDLLKTYDISEPQFNVLRILRGQNGSPVNLKDVQQRMVHRTSNTTRLVDKLIEKNLVERVIPKENRRIVEISITKKGLGLLA